MRKNKKETQEVTEEDILNELNYLIAEGFVVKMDNDTYRLKTQEELDNELNGTE